MHLVMFDIDGTLLNSYDQDSECFVLAVEDALGIKIDADWSRYNHVSDSGITHQLIHDFSLQDQNEEIASLIKENFLSRLKKSLSQKSIYPINGAKEFLLTLQSRPDIRLALATGSWLESAKIKLEASGISYSGIPIASASDHYDRTEIMKLAKKLSGDHEYQSVTYFGDGPWDLKAATQLAYDFILIGNRISFTPSFNDYSNAESMLNYLIRERSK